MKYCIVENNIVINIVDCDDSNYAYSMGWLDYYDSAEIGKPYSNPNTFESVLKRVNVLESNQNTNSAKTQALSDRQDFLEDCIAEMATQIYA